MDHRFQPDDSLITKTKQLRTRESEAALVQLEKDGGIDERSEIGSKIKLDEIIGKPEVSFHCDCTQVKDNEQLVPSHVVVTEEYLYILRPTQEYHEYIIKSRRRIDTIMRITKKAKMPDAIKIEYGTPATHHEAGRITNIDKLHVPKKADALIKCLKTIRASPESDH